MNRRADLIQSLIPHLMERHELTSIEQNVLRSSGLFFALGRSQFLIRRELNGMWWPRLLWIALRCQCGLTPALRYQEVEHV